LFLFTKIEGYGVIDPFLPFGVASFYRFDEKLSSAPFWILSKLGILVLVRDLGENSLIDYYPDKF